MISKRIQDSVTKCYVNGERERSFGAICWICPLWEKYGFKMSFKDGWDF